MEVIFIFLGIAGAIVIFINPFIGLLATVALIPQALLPAVGNMFLGAFTMVTPIKIVGGVTFFAVIFRYVIFENRLYRLQNKGVTIFLFFMAYVFLNGFAMPSSFTRENFTVFFSFFVLMILILLMVDSPKKIRAIIWFGLISVCIVAANSLINYLRFADVTARARGGAFGPNYFAMGLIPYISISFYTMLEEKKKILKIAAFLICIVLLGALLVTYSRGGYLGLAGMFLVAIFKAKRKFLGLIVVAISAILFVSFVPKHMWQRFEKTKIETGVHDATIESTERRFLLAKAALQMYLGHPVFGVGLGNYYWDCSLYQPLVPGRAHNMYLEIMAEMGTIGIVLFMSIIFGALKNFSRIIKDNGEMSNYARGFYLGMVGFLIAGLFLHDQQDKTLWIILFMSMAMVNILNESGQKNVK